MVIRGQGGEPREGDQTGAAPHPRESLKTDGNMTELGSEEEALPGCGGSGGTRAPRTHVRALPQCVTLDKLEAAPSEAALVARALELLAEHRFWAGIVFLGPEEPLDPAQLAGRGHVRVKIRMDIDAVTRTNKIRDRWGRGQVWERDWGAILPTETVIRGARASVDQGGLRWVGPGFSRQQTALPHAGSGTPARPLTP